MNILIDLMRQPSIAALGWALIHFLWQGALVGGAAFLILRAGRPERASTRYAIGVTTLALMLMTCAATFVILARQQRAAAREPVVASAFAHALRRDKSTVTFAPAAATPSAAQHLIADSAVRGPQPSPSAPAPAWRVEPLEPGALLVIVLAWAIGVFTMTLRLIGGWMLTRRLATRAAIAVSPSIDAAARAIAGRLQIRRAVAVLESRAVVVPTLVGWLKPVVLLPAAALAGLSPDQLRAILAHELAHVRRHDYLVNLLQSMVETLLFYHPATWWVSAQIRAEREHCCDDVAVEVCGDRLVYASALAELTTLARHRGLALAATDGSLLDRVQRILGGRRSMREPAPAWPLLALVVLVVGAGSFSADAIDQAAPTPQAITAPPLASTPADAGTPVAATDEQAIAAGDADADQAGAETNQAAALAAQLREQAAWLTSEAARLRAEADMIRRSDAQLRGSTWLGDWTDAPTPPPPPAAPEPPTPPSPPTVDAPAPPAPPAPPALPTPPAPPAPPQDLGSRGSGNMTWSNNGEKFSVKWTGAFRLSDDETGIDWVEEGATVTVTDGFVLTSRVELRGTGGSVERHYWRNGMRRDYEPEGRLFLAAAIDKLIRHSGVFARERVARFLKSGGPDAVLAEIDRLSDSSYVRRVYYTELLKQATVSAALLDRVLQRIPAEVKSDYDKSTLLTQAAQGPSTNDTRRVAIARAVKSITSDYDQRRVLAAILNTQPLAPAVAAGRASAVSNSLQSTVGS